MYDKDYVFEGLQAVSDFIGKLLREDPTFTFAAAGAIEFLQDSAKLSGHIRTSGGILHSTDFFSYQTKQSEPFISIPATTNRVELLRLLLPM